MRALLVLRHARAVHDDRLLTDHDRPLDERGRSDAPLVGRLLGERGLVPDRVLSSTAVRAATTARLAAEAGGFAERVEYSPALYGAGAVGYLEAVRRLAPEASRVLLVGHNPTVERLVRLLTGRIEPMPPASLAHIELEIGSWEELGRVEGPGSRPGLGHGGGSGSPAGPPREAAGRLVRLWRPVDLGRDR